MVKKKHRLLHFGTPKIYDKIRLQDEDGLIDVIKISDDDGERLDKGRLPWTRHRI